MNSELEESVTITNELGMHMRAAGRFVELAGHFAADVTLISSGMAVDGKSIMGVLSLAVPCGHTVTVKTAGPDAKEALAALISLIKNKFDEAK